MEIPPTEVLQQQESRGTGIVSFGFQMTARVFNQCHAFPSNTVSILSSVPL